MAEENLGEAVLYLRVDNSKLLSGLNEAQAAAQKTGSAMAGAFGAAGTAAGNAFGTSAANGVKTGSTGIQSGFQGVLSGLSSGAGSAGQSAGASMASRMAAGIKAGSGSILAAGQSLGNSMRSYWGGLGHQLGASINAGIVRGIGAGIGALLDTKYIAAFDAASRRVAQLAPKDRAAFAGDARAVSRQSGYGVSSTEVSKAQYQALSSGFSPSQRKEIAGAIREAAKISIISGGEADVETTAKAVFRLMNSDKRLDARTSAKYISGFQDASVGFTEKTTANSIGKLVQQASSARLNTSDILAIGAAASLKLPPERVTAGTGQLVDAIINAGTKKKPQAAAAELGVEFNSVALQKKGILGFFDDLNKKTAAYEAKHGKGKTDEVYAQLFGGIQVGSVAKAAASDMGAVRAAKGQIEGSDLDGKVKIAQEGMIQRQKQMKTSLEELDIQIKSGAVGAALSEAFGMAGAAVKALADGLDSINKVYSTLSPTQQAFVNTLAGVGLVVAGVAAGLAVIGTAIGLFGGGLTLAATALGGFLVGFGQIALAVVPIAVPITALSAAVYGLAKAFGATDTQAFTAALVAAGAGLAVVFGPAAIAAIGTAASALVAGFVSIGTAAAAALIPLLPWIAAAAGVAAALYLLKLAYDANKEAINKWLAGVVTAITPAMESVKSFGIAALAFAKSWFDGWMGVWRVVIQVAQGIASALAPVVKFVVDTFPAAWNLARAIIGKAIEGLAVDAKIKFAIISTAIQAAAKVIEFFVNWVKFSANTAISLFGAMRDAASNSFASMGRSIEDARAKFPGFDNAVKTSGNGFEAFRLTIQTQADLAGKAIQYFIDAANLGVNVLMRELDKVGQFFNNLPALINNAAKSISNFGKPSAPVPAAPSTAPATYGPNRPTAYGGGGGLFASAAIGQIVSDGAGLLAQRRSFDSAPIGSASGTRISSPIANQTLEQAKRNTTQYGAGRRGGRVHNKTDFVGSPGTPVLAIMDGVATLEGPSKWYGGVSEASVRFQSDDEKTTARYYHLDRKTRELFGNQRSMRVRAGQKVGYVGADGNVPDSVGPHLDLDLRVNGKPVTFGQFAQLVDGTASESGSTAATAAQQLALRQAKEDLDVAEKKLAEVRAEGPRGKNTAASRSAYQRRIKAAEESVRKKKQALSGLSCGQAAPEALMSSDLRISGL
jgi:murein DD-endopeptidase MepM/ murein hydrolase activator NlpD